MKRYSVFIRDGSKSSKKLIVMVDISLRDKTFEFAQNDIDNLLMPLDIDPLPFDVSFVTDEHIFTSDANYDVIFAYSADAKTIFLSVICNSLEGRQQLLLGLDKMKAIEN